MRPGSRHLVGVGAGIGPAAAVSLLLFGGEYKAFATQSWAVAQAPPGPGHGVAMGLAATSSALGAAMIATAALVVGILCGSRRLSPAAPLVAGLPLFAFGLLTWLDTWRVTLLFGGSFALPWFGLVTDQVFLVVGAVLLISAAVPSRWQPGLGSYRRSPGWKGLPLVAGIVAVPVAWYLIQLTNLTAGDYPDSYWWPFHQHSGDTVDVLFVLVIAVLGVLAASRTLRITAIIAGLPLLIMGALGLLAPTLAKDLIDAVGLGLAWRHAVLLDVTSGLPLLYGGILVTSGLIPARTARPRAAAAAAKAAPTAIAK